MVTTSKAVSPWLRFLAVALVVLIAIFFAEHIVIIFIGSDKPNPHTGQIYNVSISGRGGGVYVEFWFYVFDSIVMTALSLVILALIVRRMILGRDQKGSPREAEGD